VFKNVIELFGSVENVAKWPESAMRSFSFIQGLPPLSSKAFGLGGHERDIFNSP
jgi:hypothetical protein